MIVESSSKSVKPRGRTVIPGMGIGGTSMRRTLRMLVARAGIPVSCDEPDHDFLGSVEDDGVSRLGCLLSGMVVGGIGASVWWILYIYLAG